MLTCYLGNSQKFCDSMSRRSFLRAVLATGYAGNLSIEIFNEQTTESPKVTARAAMSSLLNVEEEARRGDDRGRPGPPSALSTPQ